MSALDALIGIKTIIDATSGSDVILSPARKALRFKGSGFIVTPQADAIDIELTGEGGATGPTGATGATGATGPTGSLATIGRLDTTHSPILLWSFDKTLTDSSGLGHTATVAAGTAVYCELWPGYFGMSFQSLRLSLTHADVQITGDITIECVMMLDAAPSNSWCVHAATGETSAANYLYALGFTSARLLTTLTESGSGTNQTWTSDTVAAPAPGVPFHFCFTRISNVNRWYINGVLAGSASGTLTAPTGGASGALLLGGDETGALTANLLIADFKIIASGLDATQVLAESNRSIGALY